MLTIQKTIRFSFRHGNGGERNAATAIYALVEGETFVSWHKHLSDGLFLYHKGGDLKVDINPYTAKHDYSRFHSVVLVG